MGLFRRTGQCKEFEAPAAAGLRPRWKSRDFNVGSRVRVSHGVAHVIACLVFTPLRLVQAVYIRSALEKVLCIDRHGHRHKLEDRVAPNVTFWYMRSMDS